MTSLKPLEQLDPPPPADDDIDLRQLVAALNRRRNWIAGSAGLGVALSGLSLLIAKPVYQGQFQIVLGNQQKQTGAASILSQNPGLAALGGLQVGSGGDSIATEVQILNSPSVLRPVFEAVKASKPPSQAQAMRFQAWAKSAITAKEEKGTSVLNVEFRDTDQALVLPITRMISQAYQSYSNRGRARELVNVITYLKTQIAEIKPQADASQRAALNWGYEQGLGLLDGLPLAGTVAGAGVSKEGMGSGQAVGGSGGSLEAARTAAQQRVKALEIQIQEASKAGAGSLYFASQLASLTDKSATFDQLTRIETEIAEKRSRFRDADPIVQKLLRERASLVGYINQQTIALLNGELDLARANLQALNRPKDVVSRHRELTQQALRDEATLVTLQNQLKQFELEQARATSPWELISTPTLLDRPVSPLKGRTLALGLLAGLVLGTGAALVVDRRSGLVFSREELQAALPYPLLAQLPAESAAWPATLQLLADGPLAGAASVALIPVGDLRQAALELHASLSAALPADASLEVCGDLHQAAHCQHQLLLARPGAASRSELQSLRQNLQLQGQPVAGLVLL